ncbi:MAG TPA: KGG domain-containing protein [Micropepsaceae bacterium]|nr:KGG domain-containing protein [Micropepsaceae bacterium]
MSRNDEHKGTSNRGFASMDQAKQRAIASKGGQSVPPEKRSFSQDPRLAAQAGRKGGESVPPEGRSFSQNRELAAEAGRKGGQARGASAQRRAAAANIGSDEAENSDMVTEGTGKTKMPRDPMNPKPARQMSRSDEAIESDEDFGRDELGNSDVESGEIGQTPGMRRQGNGKEHPHGV